jgi:hypothetical protein
MADFCHAGKALMDCVVGLSRQTQGRMDAPGADVALDVLVAWGEAGLNAFRALADMPGRTEQAKLALGGAARAFRMALGAVATQYSAPGSDLIRTTEELSARGAHGGRLAAWAGDAVGIPPPVRLSAPARAALDALRRDPLEIRASLDQPTVCGLFGAALDGLEVHRP